MAVGPEGFRLWQKDRERTIAEILAGAPFRILESEQGKYDGLLDFMLQQGLWEAATGMRPSGLKKDNGIGYSILNGLECLREMAVLETPADCGPLLKDAYLMERIGFTAERVEAGPVAGHNVIDPESLNNHLARFTAADLEAGFLRHLGVIRQKRWLRGGVYAVDGHDMVIPYGKDYEGAAATQEGSYGYKLLVLLNVQEDCELVVGYVLGSLRESEITMLRRLLARLEETMGRLQEWLKILLMDRGYWGTDLFCELKQDYGIDFVSRVRDEKMEINTVIQREIAQPKRAWSQQWEEREFSGRKERQQVLTTVLPSQLLVSDQTERMIEVNLVVAEQRHEDGSPILDKKGKDISWTTYVTTLAPGKQHGQKIRGFYRRRWGIENQGFRYLSQTWNIDRPAGHSLGAVLARLVFVFMVFNAGQLFRQASRHRPDYAAQLRGMRSYGSGVRLAGATNMAITESGFCGAFTTRELLRLGQERLRRALRRDLESGCSLEDALKHLDSS
jgi:hypothetical protein